MNDAIICKPHYPVLTITLCKALAQVLNAYWAHYDRETSDLMFALAAYVEKYSSKSK